MMIFKNRADAGRKLAARLTRYADRGDILVLALPRGGVIFSGTNEEFVQSEDHTFRMEPEQMPQ
jgi:predicted phosphoribosyltransferase